MTTKPPTKPKPQRPPKEKPPVSWYGPWGLLGQTGCCLQPVEGNVESSLRHEDSYKGKEPKSGR